MTADGNKVVRPRNGRAEVIAHSRDSRRLITCDERLTLQPSREDHQQGLYQGGAPHEHTEDARQAGEEPALSSEGL
jgi:hypothetical protein